jgi:ABC-type nitrate/sulfonate/bicarbonate transport system substrate-binding protein
VRKIAREVLEPGTLSAAILCSLRLRSTHMPTRRSVRLIARLFAAAMLAALFAQPPALHAQTKSISIIVFPGGFNWPIWVAQQKGYFSQNGIDVNLTNTPNSVFQLTGLIEGRFDIAMTAIDNVVAYMEGQGEARPNRQPDIFAFMGGDNGFLSLVTVPEVKTYADLKGRTVSVDALTTGYAFVLLDLLDRAGLKPGDFQVVQAGGVLQRWDELKQRKQAGTMLITPFDIMAQAAGFNVLQRAIDVYGRYQGLVGATRRDWASSNAKALEDFIRAYVQAVDWLGNPANRDEAISILREHLQQMSAELAAKTYTVLAPPQGFTAKARIDMEGVNTVLRLRSRYGEPKKMLSDPTRYVDLKYYDAAAQ